MRSMFALALLADGAKEETKRKKNSERLTIREQCVFCSVAFSPSNSGNNDSCIWYVLLNRKERKWVNGWISRIANEANGEKNASTKDKNGIKCMTQSWILNFCATIKIRISPDYGVYAVHGCLSMRLRDTFEWLCQF